MATWRDKVRGDWRYVFEFQRKQYAGAGHKTKAAALAAQEQRRKEVKAGMAPTKTGMAFSELANLYLDWSERRHAKKTYEYKKMVYREFLRHGGDIDIRLITPHALHQYLNSRPTTHNYNVHRKELSALFSFAVKNLQVLSVSPCWNLEKLPETQHRKAIPTQEELLRILTAAGPDERPLLHILIHTLARVDEILRLRWEDVNFDKREVVLWTRKRRDGNWEPRYHPMNQTLHNLLWSMWKRRVQQEWVFWNKRTGDRYLRRPKMMPGLCRRAGVPSYGFHSIRHFVATYLHDVAKIPTGVIGALLGHKSKRTTEVYLHSVDSRCRDAVDLIETIFDEVNSDVSMERTFLKGG